jgi:hypothetical protein
MIKAQGAPIELFSTDGGYVPWFVGEPLPEMVPVTVIGFMFNGFYQLTPRAMVFRTGDCICLEARDG